MTEPVALTTVESVELGSDADLLDWAWVGGFMDGEGSIGVSRDNNRGRHGYRAMLQLANTDISAMLRATRIMRVTNRITLLAAPTPNHAAQYHLNVREQKTLVVLLARLTPHLWVKRRQAQLVMEFVASRLARRGQGRYAAYTNREKAIYAELRELNRTGPNRRRVP